ncbi:hypothetical protein MATL_G00004060 [Megalops atlanticus]|uniref:Uncharacterized protein n=1 Tax=Megalops atlanticus TaxID=7932 RepID=A0A9D3QEX7_MEGAT|nr:hypothetical protein MATL_G00004060 [Megalops atlanticus]
MANAPTPLPRTRYQTNAIGTGPGSPTSSDTQEGSDVRNVHPLKQPPPVSPKPKSVTLSPTVRHFDTTEGRSQMTVENSKGFGYPKIKQPPPVAPKPKKVTPSPTEGPSRGCDTVDGGTPVTQSPPVLPHHAQWQKTSLNSSEEKEIPLYQEVLPVGKVAELSPPVLPCAHWAKTPLNTSEEKQIPLYQEVLPVENVTQVKNSGSVSNSYSAKPRPYLPFQNPCTGIPRDNNIGVSSKKKTSNNYENIGELMEWWKNVKREYLSCELTGMGGPPSHYKVMEDEVKAFDQKAYRVKRALHVYTHLLTKHGETLQNHIIELDSIADNLDKVYKGAKIAGITGGATGAVGGVAAVAGVILAPATMGASLLVTVAGVGAVAAGGLTGASAAITNKVCSSMDRKKVEKIVKDYMDKIREIDKCLKFISAGREQLKRHDVSRLQGVDAEAMRVAKVAEMAVNSSDAMQAASMSGGILHGFALGMEFFFVEGDANKLKKGTETKFAKKIRKLTQELQTGLYALMRVKKCSLQELT